MAKPEVLSSYDEFEFHDGRWTRTVFKKGSGPGVTIIRGMPGLHPLVVRFADHVAAAGMSAYLPNLFGEPGKPVSIGYALGELVKGICVRREFDVWATN